MKILPDWTKAPDWAIAHALYTGGTSILEVWVGESQYQTAAHTNPYPYGGGTGETRHNPHRCQFHYETPRPAPWTGEGLPPVGTVCEINHPTMDWVRCEIVAHKVMDCGGKTHAIAWIDGDTLDQSQGLRFRPIRTPEQIAEDEKQRAVSEMEAQIAKWGLTSDYNGMCQALYDAGYRKQARND